MNIAVIGAGSWGSALANLLANNGYAIRLWARRKEVALCINEKHKNPSYLTTSQLNENIYASNSLMEVMDDVDAVFVVTPSCALRNIAKDISCYVKDGEPIVLCSKGIEDKTGLLPSQIFEEVLGDSIRLAVLSGPNHAEEIVDAIPAATVIASSSSEVAKFFQNLCACNSFRTYVSNDLIGVQICSAFKNVIAIAVGASYGLGYGDNTAAMLITRGLAEMSRLVVACGGKFETCMGLAGAGDMIATCMSKHSRNRNFGEMLGTNKTLDDFTKKTHMVVEGAYACKSISVLAAKHGVELPIADLVKKVIWEGFDLSGAAHVLLTRSLKEEFYGIGD